MPCDAPLNRFLVQSSLKEAQAVIKREQMIKRSRQDAVPRLGLLEHSPVNMRSTITDATMMLINVCAIAIGILALSAR